MWTTHKNRAGSNSKGVKPVCTYQHKFENTYLYGAFSPINGDSFLLELPYCNTDCFQYFIQELSKQNPKELKLIVLDNGAFHKAKETNHTREYHFNFSAAL
ncbi:MAG: transposase [Crocinitomicaceae bacterium]|nr:transposase [Crocinitomicaceae bacterium]